MGTDTQLTPEAQRAVEAHVRGVITTWLKWIGLVNGTTLIALIAYVVFELPDVAAERLVPRLNQRVENLTTNLEKKLGEAFILSGKVEASYEHLHTRTVSLKSDLAKREGELKAVQAGNIAEVARVVSALGTSADIPALVQRVDAVEKSIQSLGTGRNGPAFTITNPSIGGADVAECPPGTFVSRVHASKGVGGRYATDGISELRVVCSPLRIQ